MSGDLPFSMVGNLVEAPELRYTSGGSPVASLRLATNPRHFDKASNQWVDDEPVFMSCTVWRDQGERAANLSKGDRVFVSGKLTQRSYETRDGQRRTVYEVDVDDLGPSLKYASVDVTRIPRSGGYDGGQSSNSQASSGWGNPAPTGTGGFGRDEPAPF